MAETLHATCVAIGGRGVLLMGAPGSGKSDLALRLIDRGATLVSDDGVTIAAEGGRAIAHAPATIAGRMEVRGLGIVTRPHVGAVPVAICVTLDQPVPRMPPETPPIRSVDGLPLPVVALAPFEASAPLKVEQALTLYGLPA